MASTLTQQIEQQEKIAATARQKILDLKKKATEAEAKRFQRLANKVGFFEAEISDVDLEAALQKLVNAAGAPQEQHETSNA